MKLSHYEVLRRENGSLWMLGAGGMGRTYRARDTRLGHEVALKIIHEYLLDEADIRERFLREARAMARINDQHVARILYLGDQEDVPFFAMEFCEGPTLLEYIREKGPLRPKEALKLAIQLASALEAVGEAGLVHRDIKPSNIILTPGRREPLLRLLDFGVARTDEGWKTLTKAGAIGTPAFASPEQLREGARVDARADLYAMGAVLWCMLTGKPPFSGTEFEIYYHVQQSPPPLDQLAGVPESITAFLATLLAKDADNRPASASAAREAMEDLLAGVTATPFFPDQQTAPPLPGAARKDIQASPARHDLPVPAETLVDAPRPSPLPAHKAAPMPARKLAPLLAAKTTGTPPVEETSLLPTRPEPSRNKPRKKPVSMVMIGSFFTVSAVIAGVWFLRPKPVPLPDPNGPNVVFTPPAPPNPTSEADVFAGTGASPVVLPPVPPVKPPVAVVVPPLVEPPTKNLINTPPTPPKVEPVIKSGGYPVGTKAGEEYKVYLAAGTEVPFVWCPPGILTREETVAELDGEPVKIAITKGFWLGKHEVTQSQYAAIMGSLPSRFEGPGTLPVDSVSWDDATEFCQKASENLKEKGLRVVLPDQHQWEYACRAGTNTPFSFGEDFGSEHGNIDGRYPAGKATAGPTSYLEATTQVGSYAPNAWGLYDMHGNVMEWCQNSASSGSKRRVLRGGSWNNRAEECRSSSRLDSEADVKLPQFGFRISLVEGRAGLGDANSGHAGERSKAGKD